MAIINNIGDLHTALGNSIGWTVETSTGYTSSGAVIQPKIGDSFYGQDYLGLTRYGNYSNTNLDTLTAQLQAIINKGPKPYTLSRDLVEKVLRDNVQNWNFNYPNGTSPVPRPWNFGGYIDIIMTPDGRLTFSKDEEPPHNHPQIHQMVDKANYYVQQFSDQPYIVLIDHLKRLGKGWKTPDKGSLWHVIHQGDVNFAKISDMIAKIPGLDSFLSQFGLSLDTLNKYAQKYLKPGGSSTGPVNPPIYSGGQFPTNQNFSMAQKPLLIAAGAGLGTYLVTKKPIYALIAGAGIFFLMSKMGGGSATDKRAALIAWENSSSDSANSKQFFSTVVNSMTDSEISAVYSYIFDYIKQSKQLPATDPLFAQIQSISSKYQIFT